MIQSYAAPVLHFSDRDVGGISRSNGLNYSGALRGDRRVSASYASSGMGNSSAYYESHDIDSTAMDAYVARAHNQRVAKTITDCTRNILVNGQAAVFFMYPSTIYWVTPHSQQQLDSGNGAVMDVAHALEPRLGTPSNEVVANELTRIWHTASPGESSHSSMHIDLSGRKFRVDIDSYSDSQELRSTMALITPASEDSDYRYEQAQLSSIRYNIGIVTNAHDASAAGHMRRPSAPHEYSDRADGPPKGAGPPMAPPVQHGSFANSHHMHDFIPSMSGREVDFFYSMLPGPSATTYSGPEHEMAPTESILEQEQHTTDPDHLDPHSRMRLMQSQSMASVVPRRPRDLAEVQAELEAAHRQGIDASNLFGFSKVTGPGSSGLENPAYKKSNGIKCLECGVDQSPEWRKGPMGPKTLCNRCGLRYAKKLRMHSK